MSGVPSTTNVETDAALQQLSTGTTSSETDLNLSNNVSGKQLVNNINDLKGVCTQISADLCKITGKVSVASISADDIKSCGRLHKSVLGEYVLSLISKCSSICHETNPNTLPRSQLGTQMDILLPEISNCIQRNLDRQAKWQHNQFQGMQEQISRLQSYSDNIQQDSYQPSTTLSNCNDYLLDTQLVSNVTKWVEDYLSNFVPEELSEKITSFLNDCPDFEENIENGHSVAMFGYPYLYHGSKHSSDATDIPGPLLELMNLIKEKYPGFDLNSILVNRYIGPNAFLPKHADDEFVIAPGSIIFTVSLGAAATVKFTEIHGKSSHEQVVEHSSMYTMSRTSQDFWQHQIPKNEEYSSGDVRYSLTLRHVSAKFLKSTVVIGDSNTRFLKFGSGVGTFGHNIPGERVEAIHIGDVNPVDCCGYKNIFIHCGVNDIKHYHKVNSADKIRSKFAELRNIIDQIRLICPNSRLVVSPILPTKSQGINQCVLYFNRLLFEYQNSCTHTFVTLDFSLFADRNGCLQSEMGRYWNAEDQLHLGSKGVRVLVKLIRSKVYDSVISPSGVYRPYNCVVKGGGVRAGRDHGAVVSSQSGITAT